jgi:hypothetical protein
MPGAHEQPQGKPCALRYRRFLLERFVYAGEQIPRTPSKKRLKGRGIKPQKGYGSLRRGGQASFPGEGGRILLEISVTLGRLFGFMYNVGSFGPAKGVSPKNREPVETNQVLRPAQKILIF